MCTPSSAPNQHPRLTGSAPCWFRTSCSIRGVCVMRSINFLLTYLLGRPLSALKLTPSRVGTWTTSITHGSLGPPKSTFQRHFARFSHYSRAHDRDRPTDRPRYSIYSKRLYLEHIQLYSTRYRHSFFYNVPCIYFILFFLCTRPTQHWFYLLYLHCKWSVGPYAF